MWGAAGWGHTPGLSLGTHHDKRVGLPVPKSKTHVRTKAQSKDKGHLTRDK